MEFRLLRSFVAVAECGHVGRAALKLHLSQPPLTRHIHQLERELGVTLFVRTPKGMELTAAGASFVEEARNLLTLAEQARERAVRADRGETGRIDVGIFGSAIFDAIPKILLAFRREYPGVNIVLHALGRRAQIEALRQRRLTLGFNRFVAPEPDIASRVVLDERLRVAVSRLSPLYSRQQVALTDLVDEPLVVFPATPRPGFIDFLQTECRRRGFEPRIEQEVSDSPTGLALVASGFGSCIIPESASNLKLPGVRYLPLTEHPPLTVDLSVLYRSDDSSPILARFLAVIDTMQGSLVGATVAPTPRGKRAAVARDKLRTRAPRST